MDLHQFLDAYHYYKAFGTNPEPLVRKTELRGTVDRTHWYIRAKYSGIPIVSSAIAIVDAAKGLAKASNTEGLITAGSSAAVTGMNAWNAFNEFSKMNPFAFGFSFSTSSSKSKYSSEATTSIGSSLKVGGDLAMSADNLTVTGSNIIANGNIDLNILNDVLIQAGKNTFTENSKSSGYSFGFSFGAVNKAGIINLFKNPNGTIDLGYNASKSWADGITWTNSTMVAGGTTYYNIGGDLTIRGANIITDAITGKVGGNTLIESLQDTYNSGSQGYSLNLSIGFNKANKYKPSISSYGIGYNQSSVEKKITTNPTSFIANSGEFTIDGTLRQVGSLIDGTFALNAGGYEYADLKDIDKSSTYGFQFTFYPNASYRARDEKGQLIVVNGQQMWNSGLAFSSQFTFGYTNLSRDVRATLGSGITTNFDTRGVNRDASQQIGDWHGTQIDTMVINPLTEYWATAAGKGKFLDVLTDFERSIESWKRALSKDENGTTFIERLLSEKKIRSWVELGIIDLAEKDHRQVVEEVRARFSAAAGKEIELHFYNPEDLDRSELDPAFLAKLDAYGFAVASDGSIWANTAHDINNTRDFNTFFFHEFDHLTGKSNEATAKYVQNAMEKFVDSISDDYLNKNGSITDWDQIRLDPSEAARLIGYTLDQMQLKEFTFTVDQLREWTQKYNIASPIKPCAVYAA